MARAERRPGPGRCPRRRGLPDGARAFPRALCRIGPPPGSFHFLDKARAQRLGRLRVSSPRASAPFGPRAPPALGLVQKEKARLEPPNRRRALGTGRALRPGRALGTGRHGQRTADKVRLTVAQGVGKGGRAMGPTLGPWWGTVPWATGNAQRARTCGSSVKPAAPGRDDAHRTSPAPPAFRLAKVQVGPPPPRHAAFGTDCRATRPFWS